MFHKLDIFNGLVILCLSSLASFYIKRLMYALVVICNVHDFEVFQYSIKLYV